MPVLNRIFHTVECETSNHHRWGIPLRKTCVTEKDKKLVCNWVIWGPKTRQAAKSFFYGEPEKTAEISTGSVQKVINEQ